LPALAFRFQFFSAAAEFRANFVGAPLKIIGICLGNNAK